MLLHSFLLSLGTSVGMAGTGFATSVLLARLLEPAARGDLAALMLAGMLAAGSAQFGLGPAFVYAHRRHRLPPGLRRAGLATVALAALLIGLAWQQAQFGTGRWSSAPLLVLLALVQALHLHACALAQRYDGLRLFNLLRGLPTLVTAVLLAGLALLGWLDPAAAALATIVGFALTVAVALRRDGDLPRDGGDGAQNDPPWQLTSHLRYSLQYHMTVLLGMLSTNVDKLWLSWSGQTQALGLYTVAYATSRLIGLVQEAASSALFSRHAGRDEAHMNEAVARVFRMTFYPLLLLCALLSLAALALWVPVFGPAYAGARGAFMLLLIECVIGGASWQLAQRFAASGQTGTVVVRQIFALLPLLALLPWIGRHHDPVLELAGATLLSSLLRLALTLGFLRHRAGLRLATLLPRLDDYHSMIDHIRQLCLSRIR